MLGVIGMAAKGGRDNLRPLDSGSATFQLSSQQVLVSRCSLLGSSKSYDFFLGASVHIKLPSPEIFLKVSLLICKFYNFMCNAMEMFRWNYTSRKYLIGFLILNHLNIPMYGGYWVC